MPLLGKGGPDVVIAVADKAARKSKGNGSDDKGDDVFMAMATDLVKAIKEDDVELIARILEAAANGVG